MVWTGLIIIVLFILAFGIKTEVPLALDERWYWKRLRASSEVSVTSEWTVQGVRGFYAVHGPGFWVFMAEDPTSSESLYGLPWMIVDFDLRTQQTKRVLCEPICFGVFDEAGSARFKSLILNKMAEESYGSASAP